ncbi:MAG: hypothetical protein ACRCXC_06910 [Legionella sp.]
MTLKGYTQGLYVDVKNNCFYMTNTNVYSQHYTQSFFATAEENI